jgi:hypothetical protein
MSKIKSFASYERRASGSSASPRSRRKIMGLDPEFETPTDVVMMLPRGKAKIRSVCSANVVWATTHHVGQAFVPDELWGIEQDEDDLIELKPAKEKPVILDRLAGFLNVKSWPKALRHLSAGGYAGKASSTLPVELLSVSAY